MGNTSPAPGSLSRSSLRWRAVLAVIAGFLQQGMSWGFLMVYGSQYKYFEDTLFVGYTRVQLATPGALAASLVLLFSVVYGRLCDNHWHRFTNTLGSILFVAGILFLAFSSGNGRRGEGNYVNVLLSYVLQGLGQSTFFVASSHIAASWFPANPGLPIGITSCGVAITGIAWPLLFTEGVARWGFRAAVCSMAGLAAACCTFICIFGVPNPAQMRRPVSRPLSIRTWVDPAALRNLEWCFATVSMCFIYFALLGLPQFLETWAQQRGLVKADTKAVIFLTVATGCSLVGRLAGSYLGNRFGFRLVHAICNLLIMVVTFAFWTTSRSWASGITFAILFGILQGAIIALPPADIKEIVDPRNKAKRTFYQKDTKASMPQVVNCRISNAVESSAMTTAANSQVSIDKADEFAPQVHSVESRSSSCQSPKTSNTHDGRHQCGLEPCTCEPVTGGIASLAGTAALNSSSEDSEKALSLLPPNTTLQERRAKLGGWLGMSFLFAAPFAVSGPLMTSWLVGRFGIDSAGWFTGTCYGISSLSLVLSILLGSLKNQSGES